MKTAGQFWKEASISQAIEVATSAVATADVLDAARKLIMAAGLTDRQQRLLDGHGDSQAYQQWADDRVPGGPATAVQTAYLADAISQYRHALYHAAYDGKSSAGQARYFALLSLDSISSVLGERLGVEATRTAFAGSFPALVF